MRSTCSSGSQRSAPAVSSTDHTIMRGDVVIGSGRITTVCVQQAPDGSMRATEIPAEIIRKLREVLSSA